MELLLKLLGIPSTSLRMVRRMVSLSNHLFGVLARTLVPYLRKLKQGKVKKFWNGYWIQALASLALGVMTTLLIFPQFNVAKPGAGLEASVKLFCLAFGFGFGCNSIIAEAAKWTGQKAVVWPPLAKAISQRAMVWPPLAKATEKGKTK